jgi:hypothetical protein
LKAIRPVIREVAIAWYRWALHDLQIKNPHHPDLFLIVVRLRDLLAERHAARCYLRRTVEWL